jgi:hypothetical protein
VEDAILLDGSAAGGELVPDGAGLFFGRQRLNKCSTEYSFLVLADSLDASAWPFHIVPWSRPPDFTSAKGNAFAGQPSFGDAQALRGEPPADPGGLYWLSSRELEPDPWTDGMCSFDRGSSPTGEARSGQFYLGGDTLALRINGADSPDSAYVQVCDACTGTQLVRFSASGPTLEARRAYVGAVRARSVEWRVVDGLTRPGGWIGVDDLQELASPGLPPPPSPPFLTWTMPVGGENFVRRSRVTLTWQVSDASAEDSLVLYLTYDGGETLRRQAGLLGSDRNYRWRVADTLATAARLRLIAFSHSGASSCATSEPFDIVGTTTDAEAPPGVGGLRALYRAGESWLEGSAPAGAEPATLELFDLRGRRLALLWQGPGGESFRVAVSGAAGGRARLARGIYFARLEAGGKAWTTRVALLSPDPR